MRTVYDYLFLFLAIATLNRSFYSQTCHVGTRQEMAVTSAIERNNRSSIYYRSVGDVTAIRLLHTHYQVCMALGSTGWCCVRLALPSARGVDDPASRCGNRAIVLLDTHAHASRCAKRGGKPKGVCSRETTLII